MRGVQDGIAENVEVALCAQAESADGDCGMLHEPEVIECPGGICRGSAIVQKPRKKSLNIKQRRD